MFPFFLCRVFANRAANKHSVGRNIVSKQIFRCDSRISLAICAQYSSISVTCRRLFLKNARIRPNDFIGILSEFVVYFFANVVLVAVGRRAVPTSVISDDVLIKAPVDVRLTEAPVLVRELLACYLPIEHSRARVVGRRP